MITIDQFNYSGGVGIGWGDATRHARGQGFIPNFKYLSGIAFKINSTGSKGMKVFIDTADSNSFPTHAFETGALASFVIPNSSLTTNLKRFNLPVPLAVTPGNQYCFYLEPWDTSTDTYADDYRDWDSSVGNPYASGKQAQYDPTAPGWLNNDSGNADSVFETYGTNSLEGISNYPQHISVGDGMSRNEGAT